VLVNGEPLTEHGTSIADDSEIVIKDPPRFVSRGGLKLEGALLHYGIDVTGFTALDVGASTGGFTDCLLQRGAVKVYAFDVGTNQLVWKLRNDPRVVSRGEVQRAPHAACGPERTYRHRGRRRVFHFTHAWRCLRSSRCSSLEPTESCW